MPPGACKVREPIELAALCFKFMANLLGAQAWPLHLGRRRSDLCSYSSAMTAPPWRTVREADRHRSTL